MFLILSGCGKDNTEPVSGAAIKQSLKPEMFLQDLKEEAEMVLAVTDKLRAMDIPSNHEMQPGKQTLLNFLMTAKEPLGHTMYVWGGGWNEEDTAAGEEARSIGESPRWREFAEMQGNSCR